jgi:UDP-N-acetylglucosamine 2-epimerase
MKRVAIVFGTRPEGIKLAPVIHECRRRSNEIDARVINTGQHQELLRPVLEFFSLPVDQHLEVMRPEQTLTQLTSNLLTELDRTFQQDRPDVVVVQGDTTTAMAAAMSAFYHRIPVAHVEAGLRTDDLASPFPEELNRRVLGQIASLHLAPTPRARAMIERDALLVLGSRVAVTGNTVIDALYQTAERVSISPPPDAALDAVRTWRAAGPDRRVILVTGHRRENFGDPMREFFSALRDIERLQPNVLIVFPVHLNPNVQRAASEVLSGASNVLLTPPKDYPTFVALMLAADLIITDSGGVQEEAPALGKPVLVTRTTTERPDGFDAGVVRLVGPHRGMILSEVNRLLSDRDYYRQMAAGGSPYGDGHAATRIVGLLLGEKVEEFNPHLTRTSGK